MRDVRDIRAMSYEDAVETKPLCLLNGYEDESNVMVFNLFHAEYKIQI